VAYGGASAGTGQALCIVLGDLPGEVQGDGHGEGPLGNGVP
jgi:hypothetical protein